MHKSVKKLMPLTLSLLAMVLSSCGNTKYSVADSVTLSYKFISLFEGETKKIDARTTPRSVDPAELVYESSDTSVATINDKGELTAKGKGNATITVKDKTSGASDTLFVSVDKDDLAGSDAKTVAKAITTYQADNKMKCTKVYERENFSYTRHKNSDLQQSTYYTQDMVVSVDDAYFYIGSDDERIKVEGGSKEYTSSAWYIYTNESYDTYLFHVDGITKNYMVCDSTSFISQGGSRYDALLEVLSNLFKSGTSIITGTLSDVIGKDNLDSAKSATKAGSRGDGYLTYEMTQTGSGKADKDDEDDNAIPYGTPYEIEINVRFAWENYQCVSQDLVQKQTFAIGEDSYEDSYAINYYYQTEDVELVYPDRDSFTKVDNIFDL